MRRNPAGSELGHVGQDRLLADPGEAGFSRTGAAVATPDQIILGILKNIPVDYLSAAAGASEHITPSRILDGSACLLQWSV